MSEENVKIVKEYIKLWSRGDIEAAMAFQHPDLVVHEPPSLPYGGTHRGIKNALAMLQMIGELWEVTGELKIETYDGGGDVVFNCIQFPARSKKPGRKYLLMWWKKIR